MAGPPSAFVAACAAGKWSQAIQYCTKLLQGDRENPSLLCDRALCYIQFDLNKHALKDCDAAIQCATPGHTVKALLYRGQALANLGRLSEAIASWQQARDQMLTGEGRSTFDLGIFLQLQRLVDDLSQNKVPPNPVQTLQNSSSISIAKRPLQTPQPLTSVQAAAASASPVESSVSNQASIAYSSGADASSLAEQALPPAAKQAKTSTSDAQVSGDQEALIAEESGVAKTSGSASKAAISVPGSKQAISDRAFHEPELPNASGTTPLSTASLDHSTRVSVLKQSRSEAISLNDAQAERIPSPNLKKSSSETSRSWTHEVRSDGKSDGSKVASSSPSISSSKGRKSNTPEKRNGKSRSESSSSRVYESSRDSEAGARSGGAASCSGRQGSTTDTAEIRGDISEDPRSVNSHRGEEPSPRELKEEKPVKKAAKKEEKLPPKSYVNGPDVQVTTGFMEVNKGNLAGAVAIFDKILETDWNNAAALIGRGSAYALQSNRNDDGLSPLELFEQSKQKLKVAVADFTAAIQFEPRLAEAWKRRGQARAALGEVKEAVADLTEALRLDPTSPDAYSERGTCYFKLRDYRKAEADVRANLRMQPRNADGFRLLGRVLISQGDCRTGIAQLLKAVEVNPTAKDVYVNIAQAYKEISDTEKATAYFQKALASGEKSIATYHLWGLMRYSLGDHRGALELFNKVLQEEPRHLEGKYLKGACLHAIGRYTEAVTEYNDCLEIGDRSKDESKMVAFLAFYQREVARYTYAKQWGSLEGFDIDQDLDPAFKEAWCKKLNPVFLPPALHQPTFQQAEKVSGGEQGDVRTRHRRVLLTLADRIGQRVQYSCDGFVRNSRQHRMAGLAALEVAQTVLASWQAMREARQQLLAGEQGAETLTHGEQLQAPTDAPPASAVESPLSTSAPSPAPSNSGPPSPSTTRLKKVGRKSGEKLVSSQKGGFHTVGRGQILGWREVFDTVVKWRQIVEPCDPVVWVDMLSEKEFAAGFGSHTPLLLGHSKVVRYYPNFSRAFAVAKELMLIKDEVRNARDEPVFLLDKERRGAVAAAADCEALYRVIKEDVWISTPCLSTLRPGKILDGTRLTLQKQRDVEKAYEFSIRTPCTPERWRKFDKELAFAWEAVCKAACDRLDRPDDEERKRCLWDRILALIFYWYNFMPLCRGTAVVGYITLLGLFLAAGMEVTASIPQGLQVDWEAILTPDVEIFCSAVRPWLYTSLKPIDITGDAREQGSSKGVPKVVDAFPTVQSVVSALSTAESRWRDVESE